MIRLELPYPPSLNTYYRHVGAKVLISAKGRDYRRDILNRVRFSYPNAIAGRLRVTIDLYPPDRRRRDVDNTLKAMLDAMQHAGIYEDDEQIDELRLTRREVRKGGLVVVTITPLEDTP